MNRSAFRLLLILALAVGLLIFNASLLFSSVADPDIAALELLPETVFEAANLMYAESDFNGALERYRSLEQQSPAANLYYNIGCAEFKKGNLGYAVLAFEKAKLYGRHDENIKINLEFVTRQAIDKLPEESLGSTFLFWMSSLLSNAWTTFLVVFMVWMLSLSLILHIWLRRRRWLIACFALGGLLLLVLMPFLAQIYVNEFQSFAIIIAPTASVKNGPRSSHATLFQLHEASKVQILDSLNEWHLIRLSDGREGWIQSENLGVIELTQ